MVQHITDEGLALVSQAIEAANTQVQHLDLSSFNPVNFFMCLSQDIFG